jgi:hypothetical protein
LAKNGVDLEALHLLTEADLEKLGVLLGHRRKLVKAIAELEGGEAAAPNRSKRPRLLESPKIRIRQGQADEKGITEGHS